MPDDRELKTQWGKAQDGFRGGGWIGRALSGGPDFSRDVTHSFSRGFVPTEVGPTRPSESNVEYHPGTHHEPGGKGRRQPQFVLVISHQSSNPSLRERPSLSQRTPLGFHKPRDPEIGQ